VVKRGARGISRGATLIGKINQFFPLWNCFKGNDLFFFAIEVLFWLKSAKVISHSIPFTERLLLTYLPLRTFILFVFILKVYIFFVKQFEGVVCYNKK